MITSQETPLPVLDKPHIDSEAWKQWVKNIESKGYTVKSVFRDENGIVGFAVVCKKEAQADA